MKKSFTEEQVIGFLREAEAATWCPVGIYTLTCPWQAVAIAPKTHVIVAV